MSIWLIVLSSAAVGFIGMFAVNWLGELLRINRKYADQAYRWREMCTTPETLAFPTTALGSLPRRRWDCRRITRDGFDVVVMPTPTFELLAKAGDFTYTETRN